MAEEPPRIVDDVDYMRGGIRFETSSSILRSTSKYLNSPLFREVFCNEALRKSGPDMLTTSLVPDFYAASDPLLDREAIARRIAEDAARLPEFAAWLKERPAGNIAYDDVRNCAPGTLGHGVKVLLESGFRIYFGRLGEATSDFDWIRQRRGQIHDLEHIVTGYPTTLIGEIGLSVANIVFTYRYLQPELARDVVLVQNYLLAARVMRLTLHHPEAVLTMLDAVERGKALGEAVRRPLFMERWEDHLDEHLPTLRARYAIPEPAHDERWNWSEPEATALYAPLQTAAYDGR